MIKGLDRFPELCDAVKYVRDNVSYCKTAGDAALYLRTNIPKESYYQKKIMDYVKKEYPASFVYKTAQGNYSQKGIPDVTAIIDGRYFGFEIKRPYFGEVSPLQKQTIKKIRKAGGIAGVCTFPEDAEKLIQEGLHHE